LPWQAEKQSPSQQGGTCPLSEIRVTTVSDTAGTGPVTLTKQHAPKVWCDLDGTGTIAFDGSFNCASATDNATGDYTIAYTNSMSDTHYSLTGAASNRRVVVIISKGTANSNLYSQDHNDSTNEADADPFCIQICGDLA